MKRIILAAILLLLTIPAQAQLSNAYKTVRETVTEVQLPGMKSQKNCPVHAYTPRGEILRSPWEIEPQWNILDIPSNGRVQGRTENFGIKIVHNLSASFGVYVRYGIRNTEKNSVEGSIYEKDWKTQEALGGAFLYLTPVIKVYAGAGKIWPENDGGSPTLSTAFERGLAFDVPISDYKLVISYRVMEAQLDKSKPDVSEIMADGSYQSIGISLSIPLNYGEGVKD